MVLFSQVSVQIAISALVESRSVTVCRRLSRVFVFSCFSFRVNVLADGESVFFVVVFCHFRENGNRWCSDKLNKQTLIYSIVV